MPTEKSLQNLRVTPAQRAANIEKMRKTRRAQMEGQYRELYTKIRWIGGIYTQAQLATMLGVSRAMVSRAIKWGKEHEQEVKDNAVTG